MATGTVAPARNGQSAESEALVDVRNLKIYFPVMAGFLISRKIAEKKAVDDVPFSVKRGETLGLVGESGCGKSTPGRAILQLYRPTDGHIYFEGTDLGSLRGNDLRRMRRRMQMIFQDPYASLNPRMSIRDIIGEPLTIHNLGNKSERRERVAELMRIVGLNPYYASRFPHEFSGGQRQRIGVARALAVSPDLIRWERALPPAPDLAVVRHISDRVVVMYLGHLMEMADRNEIYDNPLHPYTKALLSAVPIPDPVLERKRERIILTGEVPSSLRPPRGCVFHTRCPIAIDECRQVVPEWREAAPGHWVACHRV